MAVQLRCVWTATALLVIQAMGGMFTAIWAEAPVNWIPSHVEHITHEAARLTDPLELEVTPATSSLQAVDVSLPEFDGSEQAEHRTLYGHVETFLEEDTVFSPIPFQETPLLPRKLELVELENIPTEEEQSIASFQASLNYSNPLSLPELAINDENQKPAWTRNDTFKRAEKTLFFLLLFANSTNDNIQSRAIAGENLKKNFTSPIARAIEGYRIDDNPFYINYVAHPIDWFLLGAYAKAAGASDKEAFLMTSVFGNIFWEYVAEGSYIAPSGKDLITNFVSSAVGIYAYNKIFGKYADKMYAKAVAFGKKHHIEFKPTFGVSPTGRGGTIASTIIIRR